MAGTMHQWNRDDLVARPILGSVHAALAALPASRFPGHGELNALADSRSIRSMGGAAIRFVPPFPAPRSFDEQYEVRAYRDGAVATRPHSWHDLFNALAWMAFPRTKAMLNARHHEELAKHAGGSLRGTVRDVLTLFDEGGIFVASASETLSALLRGERWKELFWEHRDEVRRSMRFFVFGHSVLEKALTPYPGVTAKALIVPVDDAFLHADEALQRATLDAAGAAHHARDDALCSTRVLGPLPILGVPGWTPDNEVPAYYDDTRHFRPPRQAFARPAARLSDGRSG